MLIEVKVPILAESVAEAVLMKWHKKAGDKVTRGENLIDIETDKVTLEVAAPNDGTLVEIIKQDGEEVNSDEVIAKIDTEASTEQPGESTPTEAITNQAETPVQQTPSAPEQRSVSHTEPPVLTEQPKLSPAVRNLLENYELKADQIPTSNQEGRLTKEDVLQYIEARKTVSTTTPESLPSQDTSRKNVQTTVAENETETRPDTTIAQTPAKVPQQTEILPQNKETVAKEEEKSPAPVSDNRPEDRVPMTRLRKRAAQRLLSAQHENALLTTFNEVNMQPVMTLRTKYKEEFESAHGVKLGFMSFFTKAAVEALKKFPVINASVDGDDIIYHGYFDIGIAVSAPRGLVVPILRDANTLGFADIEKQIRSFGERANDSKLTIEELTGGTFTITNGGVFGSLLSTPIINPPQSAILGMHKIQERPVAENGEVVIRPMMFLALSYDHRIIDGREAVQFLVTIKEQIEDPTRLFLQV